MAAAAPQEKRGWKIKRYKKRRDWRSLPASPDCHGRLHSATTKPGPGTPREAVPCASYGEHTERWGARKNRFSVFRQLWRRAPWPCSVLLAGGEVVPEGRTREGRPSEGAGWHGHGGRGASAERLCPAARRSPTLFGCLNHRWHLKNCIILAGSGVRKIWENPNIAGVNFDFTKFRPGFLAVGVFPSSFHLW